MKTFLLACCLLTVACGTIEKVDPAIPSTPTPDQPCGPVDVVCYDKNGHVDGCCGENDTCGGAFPSVGCPADSCCNLGGDTAFGATRYAKRAPAR